MNHQIILTFVVLILALVSFATELLPVDITALTVAVTLALLGIVTPDQAIAGFSNSATITVLAMLILSAGIERTGVVQVVSEFLLKQGGKNPSRQIFVLGSIVGPITAVLNNTAVVAIFMPIVEEWCRKQNISVSKLLIPLSYSTILGGMITVIGTSTNVLASGLSKKLGYGEFPIFVFAPLATITFVLGLLYLALFAPKLLPDRKSSDSKLIGEEYQIKEYFSELIIPPRSDLIGKTIKSSAIEDRFDIDVLELIHNEEFFNQPLVDKVLNAGDILIVRSSREKLVKIIDERGIEILSQVEFNKELIQSKLSSGEQAMAEALVISKSSFVGATLKEVQFRQRYNATVLAIRRGEEIIHDRLNSVKLRFGDVLFIQGPKESFRSLQTSQDLLVMEPRDLELLRRDKAKIALGIGLGVIAAAAFNLVPMLISALVGVILMIITGVLKPREIYTSVRWDIIFLLAGLIPLGTAMEKSGATEWLADRLVGISGQVSGYWLLFAFYLVTTLLTEILSNNAAVVVLLPVAVKVAEILHLNPFAFMFVVTFAASSSFLTPIGYQTNTMVYGPGGYKFLDFTKVGGPLNIMLTFVTPLLIILIYGLNTVATKSPT